MSTVVIVIFVVVALFTCWFVPWYHERDPTAVVRYVRKSPRAQRCSASLSLSPASSPRSKKPIRAAR